MSSVYERGEQPYPVCGSMSTGFDLECKTNEQEVGRSEMEKVILLYRKLNGSAAPPYRGYGFDTIAGAREYLAAHPNAAGLFVGGTAYEPTESGLRQAEADGALAA
jgi:hypothetical protein